MNKVQHCLHLLAAAALLLASATVSATNDQPVANKETSPLLLAEMHQSMGHGMNKQQGGQMQERDMKNMDHSQHQNMGGQQMQHENREGMEDTADESEQADSPTNELAPANATDAAKQ